jgi:hypothetical protein
MVLLLNLSLILPLALSACTRHYSDSSGTQSKAEFSETISETENSSEHSNTATTNTSGSSVVSGAKNPASPSAASSVVEIRYNGKKVSAYTISVAN